MLVSAASSAQMGLLRAERAVDASAAAVTRAFAPATDDGTAPIARIGQRDPLDGVDVGDVSGALVQMISAQRAFSASLAVLRTDNEMQRTMLDRLR